MPKNLCTSTKIIVKYYTPHLNKSYYFLIYIFILRLTDIKFHVG